MTGATVKEALGSLLTRWIPARAVTSIVAGITEGAQPVGTLDLVALQHVMAQVETGIKLFGGTWTPEVRREVRTRLTAGRAPAPRTVRVPVASDADVMSAQTQTQTICRGFFKATDNVRLATAVSELARNIYLYAGRGTVTLSLAEDAGAVRFDVVAADEGPGIANLDEIMSGAYVSRTGLGRGLKGTKVLLDGLEVDTAKGRGTRVHGWKRVRS